MVTKEALQLAVVFLVFSRFTTHQAWAEQECYQEKIKVMNDCKKTITKHGRYIAPSPLCCHVVEASGMACICSILLPEDEDEIGPSKLVRQAKDCQKPVPVGSKCGSITVEQ
ncbi:hypothetical protein SETIT_6G033000v2 [Setaria italica]|uniref:Bifunctional inhibitor/plant lipid transfer protein/seed storage helical domain-containing protein n=1 Tax=Setaria italica TaxID=4555 RepID=A0A368RI07_SETIT|nr:hypothetical protein SETIT_6G033000v2 [Setaria italica]